MLNSDGNDTIYGESDAYPQFKEHIFDWNIEQPGHSSSTVDTISYVIPEQDATPIEVFKKSVSPV